MGRKHEYAENDYRYGPSNSGPEIKGKNLPLLILVLATLFLLSYLGEFKATTHNGEYGIGYVSPYGDAYIGVDTSPIGIEAYLNMSPIDLEFNLGGE